MKKKVFYNQRASAWIMCAPALITLFIFVIVPFLMSFMYSFTNKQFVMAENNPLKFVGLENYKRVLTSGDMIAAAKNTVQYTFYVVPALTILPLLLALLLNNQLKGMTFFRIVCYFHGSGFHCMGIYLRFIKEQHDEYDPRFFRPPPTGVAERPGTVSVFHCGYERVVGCRL